MGDKESQLAKIHKEQRRIFHNTIEDNSKNRLKKISNKKITTTFIFALSEFENVFGLDLWGHGLPDDQLTDQQKANKQRWEQVRTNILNKGNAQARALVAEIDLHNIKFCGYHIDFGR